VELLTEAEAATCQRFTAVPSHAVPHPRDQLKAKSIDDALQLFDLLMVAELLGKAQREADKEKVRRQVGKSAEVSVTALNLLQAAVGYVNAILVQRVRPEPLWQARLADAYQCGPPALFWSYLNPYGRFGLGMSTHLGAPSPLSAPAAA
jgi:hypothetical protein